MISYLNAHPEIEQIVLAVGTTYEYEPLRTLLKQISSKKIFLVGYLTKDNSAMLEYCFQRDKKRGLYSGIESFSYIDMASFQGLEGEWTLCAEYISPQDLLELYKYKPERLLAIIWEERITAFKLWEQYRLSCSYIQIKTLRSNKSPQVLEWKKRYNNEPELSIIFPMYNIANYLDECISSVTAWDAPYIEFLFVNDGSPDNSRDIVLKWAEKDSRIKLLDKPNGGCASARQFGLEHAKGNYIGFIDPDDFIDESMLRKLLRAAMTGSYDLSYCGYNEYYENSKEHRRVVDSLQAPYCDGTDDLVKIRELIMYCRVAIWRGIYKAEMLKKHNIHFYTDLRRFDDLAFKVEVFAAAKSVIAIPEYLYYYRLSRPGQDVSADDERLYVHFDIFKYLNQSIASLQDARLTDYLQMVKIQTHTYALKKIKAEYKKVYIKRAKEDLETTGTRRRTYYLAKKYIGKQSANNYKAIINENIRNF